MTSSVVQVHEFPGELDRPPAASSKWDAHAWVALGLASLVASGIMCVVVVAYAHVP